MNKIYYTRLTFKGICCEVKLIPHGDGFDIEINTKKRISGDYFQALRQYLETEGFYDAAREWCGINN
jgi:hypothetical protein